MLKHEKYSKLSDEELVAIYHNGDMGAIEYLVEKYKNLVRMKARAYFLIGADREDLLQEGMIGLYKAVRDYNPERDALFMTFASLCIGRQINTAVRTYNRKKNIPLNGYVSLDSTIKDAESNEDVRLEDILATNETQNPENLIIDREQTASLIAVVNESLSKMETEVFDLYKEGLSYTEIARILNKSPKTIDNAIQRIRSKILNILDNS